MHNHVLPVGPNRRVRAHVHGREVIVHGKLDGNITGRDRVELKRTAIVVGDVSTQRIVIEDGAFFKGNIDVQAKAESAKPAAAAVTTPSVTSNT